MTAGKKSCNAPQCGQVPRNFENCDNFRHHCQICAAPVNFHFLLQCRTICPIWAQCRQLGAIGTTGLRFAAMPAMRPQCPQCAAMALSRLSGAAGSCHAPAMPSGRAAMQPLCGKPRWNARRPGPRPARPAMHAQCSAMGASRAHCSPTHTIGTMRPCWAPSTRNASAMGRNASAMGAMGAMGGQCVLYARNSAMRPQ